MYRVPMGGAKDFWELLTYVCDLNISQLQVLNIGTPWGYNPLTYGMAPFFYSCKSFASILNYTLKLTRLSRVEDPYADGI